MNFERDFLIFYSWQSDLPANTNLKAIRNALRTASTLIEDESDVRIIVDEATRGESGSPNIPATILQKIASCDLFVCDLTTINSDTSNKFRRTPNPNVLFELGYAVSLLGWGRIIMLFNKHFGNFPDDLPFDIDRHRASPFLLSEEDSKNKSNTSNLNTLLKTAINAVIIDNPPRPSDALTKTPSEIKRIRDIENLTWIFSKIHLPSLDQMILALPHQLNDKIFYFWESFRGAADNSLFHLYDDTAAQYVTEILSGWSGCLSHDEQYHMTQNPNIYIFSNPGDAPLRGEQEIAWNEINKSRALLRRALDELLSHIRNDYIEIDIEALSLNSWRDYIAHERAQLDDSDI
ncbi:hypothetical protein [Citrobacter youngae]|uniref:hypothetical protein n=1 Tax=Citrobacter youngae TaxID=133448 RepID=UPI003EDF2A3F